jgi:putative transposase
MPPWGAAFLAAYRRPQKPTVAEALRDLARPGALAEGVAPPSYDQARRWLTKLGEVERRRGRLGPRNLKAVKPFTRRDTTGLRPGDVYTADGHTFDAEVAHPFTGKPFRPEITLVLDVATRMAVGWSCTLAESALAVLDALRHAATRHGIPALFYVDRGPGYINALLNAPGAGLLPRLGTQITHALPYNSQARGLVERAHRTILVGAAKRLPTYMGAAMDSEAKQIAFKRTRADGRGLIPWADFCRLIDASCAAYNERPHRGLERVTDAAGKRRHPTPREAWDGHLTQGWAPVLPEDPDSLFRPRVARTVRRGEVSLFGNTYFAHDLAEWHGTEVFVAYDVWDGERVWVHDTGGALICTAQADANRVAYFPQSQIEHAQRTRAQGRLRRIDSKRREIEAEAGYRATPAPPSPDEEQAAQEHLARLHPPAPQAPVDTAPGAPRPRFSGDFAERDWGRWCWNNREQLDADERAEFEARLHSVNFRLLIGVPPAEAAG